MSEHFSVKLVFICNISYPPAGKIIIFYLIIGFYFKVSPSTFMTIAVPLWSLIIHI